MAATLDHIVLGASDLERGVAWLEERTGVRAAFGGAHPGRGTHNALVQLGSQTYLEILAPAPNQAPQSRYPDLPDLREPRLIAWAARVPDIEAQAKMARAAGFKLIGPEGNSRARPDGRILRWRFFRLQDDRGGLLPFFIEWDRESVHPSADAPAGCRLKRFFLQSPDAEELSKTCRHLGIDVAVEHGEEPDAQARISCAKGEVDITSREG
jgi:catechol 2,3-dioxygenase-like lactoylglutathione lyase family enzyme